MSTISIGVSESGHVEARTEHVPARPEVVVAYLQQRLAATAGTLPAAAEQVTGELRAAAHDLPHQVAALGEAFDEAARGGKSADPFRIVRSSASQAITSAQRSSTTDRIIYPGVRDARGETLREFRTSVTTAYTRAGKSVIEEPTPNQTATAYQGARQEVLADIKAEIDAILAEAEAGYESGLGELRRQLITDALNEYFGTVNVTIAEIRKALKLDPELGAAALGADARLRGSDIMGALGSARKMQRAFGDRQYEQIKEARKLFESAGLIPTEQIEAQIRAVILSYPHRLDAKLNAVIQTWLPRLVTRPPETLDSGLSRGAVMVSTAMKALAARGVSGPEMVASLRRQASVQLDARTLGDDGPLREAMAMIDQIEADLNAGKS